MKKMHRVFSLDHDQFPDTTHLILCDMESGESTFVYTYTYVEKGETIYSERHGLSDWPASRADWLLEGYMGAYYEVEVS